MLPAALTYPELIRRNEAAVVFVKVLKGFEHSFLLVKLAQVNRGSDELLVIDELVSIDINLPHNLLNLPSGVAGKEKGFS